jgi:predicted PurR-regulated permease PerM
LLDVLIRAGLIIAMAMLCYQVFYPFRTLMVWALIVTLPAIIYIWSSGGYSNTAAIAYTVVLFLSGKADNVLKPLMLGRGVDAPMPIVLLGALGGMATAGILGMFVGATLLALGYQIFMGWVATDPDAGQAQAESDAQTAS